EMDNDPEGRMKAREKAFVTAEGLGRAVCGDQAVFTSILPDLVRGDAARLFSFGRGLALATENRRSVWQQLTQALAETEDGNRNLDALRGFLNGVSEVDQHLLESLLDESVA